MKFIFKMNNINLIKIRENKIKIVDNLNPKELKYSKDITKDSYSDYILDNTFCIFKSINNDLIYLIYSNKKISIISYNLIDNKKIIEIKNAHQNLITNFRYHLDKTNEKDLILSISADDNNIKLWLFSNFECITNIKNINENGKLYSACFLNDNYRDYIITSQSRKYLGNISELIKVFDFNGKKVREINNSGDRTNFIDTFYDNKKSKIYIITGNYGNIKSYDYTGNKIYHIYSDNDSAGHYNIIINDKEEIIKLIESNSDGLIKIWNFHTAKLLMKIKVDNCRLFGLCLWNKDYLFVGCLDGTLKLIEIKSSRIIKELNGHNSIVLTIKKFYHPMFGECLVSQGSLDDPIRLWNYSFKIST